MTAKIWKLLPIDAERITCECGDRAAYGYTANGGAPFFYECVNCMIITLFQRIFS